MLTTNIDAIWYACAVLTSGPWIEQYYRGIKLPTISYALETVVTRTTIDSSEHQIIQALRETVPLKHLEVVRRSAQQVSDNLWISGEYPLTMPIIIAQLMNISLIVRCCGPFHDVSHGQIAFFWESKVSLFSGSAGITLERGWIKGPETHHEVMRLTIPLVDADNEKYDVYLDDDVLSTIHSLANGKEILFHCREGRHRSSLVVAAYMLWAKRCPSVSMALATIERARPMALPTVEAQHFLSQRFFS